MKCVAEPRRAPPLGVQLEAAKRQIIGFMQALGMIPADVDPASVKLECDHDPALGLRDIDPLTRQHVPHQHDAQHLVFRPDTRHAVKTRGTGATTAGSDVGEMRKTRQLVKARVARGEVEADDPSIAPWAPNTAREVPRRAWPKKPKPPRRQQRSATTIPEKLAITYQRDR
nr:hypothetical protein NG677_04505 [Methylobacterium sp. OTU13CASTA1]